MFSEKETRRFQFLSSLFGREEPGRRRRAPLQLNEGPRFNYLKLGGSFSRGRIRHCDTWDFDSSNPRFLVDRDGKRLSADQERVSQRKLRNGIFGG